MKQYKELLYTVLTQGTPKSDRTGTGTISYFGGQCRYDLSKGFPAVTTKKLAFKSVVSELLWFLEGSSNERRLAEIHYGLPKEQLVEKTTIWTANAQDYAARMNELNVDMDDGDLGPVYGEQWRMWASSRMGRFVDQISDLIHGLKTNPDSRRHIINAWNVEHIKSMALPPCHVLSQFYVADNKLSCHLYQRSADVFLGVPFNIASYSLLTHMIAQVCQFEVGDFIHSFGDVHIYNNHIEQVKEQMSRSTFDLPTLVLNPEIVDIFSFKMSDIKLENYQSHPSISAAMAV